MFILVFNMFRKEQQNFENGTNNKGGLFNKAMGIFGRKRQDSDFESTIALDEESGGRFGKFNLWKKGGNMVNSMNSKAMEVQVRAENYKYGVLMMLSGLFVISLGFMYLPFIAISPHKFCALLSIGSVLELAALSMMIGFENMVKKLLKKDIFWYTLAYVLSLILGIYYSCVAPSYILALVFTVAEVI